MSLSRQQLHELMTVRAEVCVSVYLPTHRGGAEVQQDPIRLKNLLREAEEELARGGRRPDTKLLEPAWRLVEDQLFWRHQSEGLALFVAPGAFHSYHLPRQFEERVVVGERFYLKPLLPLVSGDGRFYVLALSQNQVRLLEATRHSIRELPLGEEVPQSLPEALGHDWEERSLQFHSGTAASKGHRGTIFHGHGVGKDDEKQEIVQFCHYVDRGLRNLLEDQSLPLVVAAVEYVIPIFRDASAYPRVLERGVPGNPETVPLEELRKRAWEIVEPEFLAAEEQARQRFEDLAGTARATAALEEIVPASHDGRIETLFVAEGTQGWGSYDPETRQVEVRPEPADGDQDLLDLVALQCLLHGGEVFAVPAERIPGGASQAAIFRY